jgi:hypothetical protein
MKYLRPISSPLRAGHFKEAREERRDGVIAPLAMHVRSPRKGRGLYGIIRKISRTISQKSVVFWRRSVVLGIDLDSSQQ